MLAPLLVLVLLAPPAPPPAAPAAPPGAVILPMTPPQPYAQTSEALRQELTTGLLDPAQPHHAFFREWSARYPDDWRRLLDDLVARVQRGDSQEELRLTVYVTMRSFTARHQHYVGLASDRTLLALFERQQRTLPLIGAENPAVCAAIFASRAVPPNYEPADPTILRMMEDDNVETLRAMDEGRRAPVRRPAPDPADHDRVVAAYRAAGGDARMHDDYDAFLALPASHQCQEAQRFFRTVLMLPVDLRTRWVASQFTQPERERDRPI